MWYNLLSEYLLKEGYKNDSICPCIFIKRTGPEYVIIVVYVDDHNIIETSGELTKAAEYLKKEFEMKDFRKTKFCLRFQIEHLKNGILIHQNVYTKKLLKRFYMDKSHLLSTPMVVRTLDVEKDPFRPLDDDEEILCPEVPYLSAIGALLFLASHTRPNISFLSNLLARYSSCPTRRHWNWVKQIFRYLQGIKDMGLYYTIPSERNLVGFADAGYLSDPHTGLSQTGYVFTSSNTVISWRSVKQIMSATSSNHAEILAIHEASQECVWLRNVIQHNRESCRISSSEEDPTIVHEDNATCIAQLKDGYIKGDSNKHILPSSSLMTRRKVVILLFNRFVQAIA
ncbi:transposable element [Tanacetum coccineum]|uniref:Transposable element n=1 Tax=Tanacetum coccineum TaxID=301880 RepID=A0ABQ4WL36_9ASTR